MSTRRSTKRVDPNKRPWMDVDTTIGDQASREAAARTAGWDGLKSWPYKSPCMSLNPHYPHDFTSYYGQPHTCDGYLWKTKPVPPPAPSTRAVFTVAGAHTAITCGDCATELAVIESGTSLPAALAEIATHICPSPPTATPAQPGREERS